MSGDNPLLRSAPPVDSLSGDIAMSADDEMALPPRAGLRSGKKGLLRTNAESPLNRPVNLEGLAQVVGLALGSPEFQRR
jgi:hypothetical protein